MSVWRRGVRYLGQVPAIRRQLLASTEAERLAERLAGTFPPTSAHAGVALAYSAVEDPFYLALFGRIAGDVCRLTGGRAECVHGRSLNLGEAESAGKLALDRWFTGRLRGLKWRRTYRRHANGDGYRSTGIQPVGDVVEFLRAWRAWRALRRRDDLIGMSSHGIPVGDLVNDSYLRFRPNHTVDLRDPYLLVVLWQAFRDSRRARRYFFGSRPAVFLASYTTYIQHGIAVRMALAADADVYAFGNVQQVCKRLVPGDAMQTRDPRDYARGFEAIDDPSQALADAERVLSGRLRGEVDRATVYMRTSAYNASQAEVPDVEGAVVVFLHDFFDSPHVYHDMVFHDFWEWITVTLQTLTGAGIPFVVKPHPNQIVGSREVIPRLAAAFPAARFVEPGVTNVQLVEGGARCAVTVYGTVAHEMAYLGIPTITCARHPHVAFSFCANATDVEGYRALLRGAASLRIDPEQARRESLVFFHMHNRVDDPEEEALRDALVDARFAFNAGRLEDAEVATGAATRGAGWGAMIRGFAAGLDARAPAGRP